nr:uncharacterized protein LOC128689657 [Cherax quadricarinatus]
MHPSQWLVTTLAALLSQTQAPAEVVMGVGKEAVGIENENVVSLEEEEEVEGVEVLEQFVDQHLPGCHLVLLTATSNSPVFSSILRRSSATLKSAVVVDLASLYRQEQQQQQQTQQQVAKQYSQQQVIQDADHESRNQVAYVAHVRAAQDKITLEQVVQDKITQDQITLDKVAQRKLIKGLFGGLNTNCRSVVLDISKSDNISRALR